MAQNLQSPTQIEPARIVTLTGELPDIVAELSESNWLLQEALLRGELDRGEAERITRLPERSGRRVLKKLTDAGLLASNTPKAPVSLRFPASTLDVLFPRLYS